MVRTKYFDGIRNAQAAQQPVSALPPFDIERMRKRGGIFSRLMGRMLEDPRWALGIIRKIRPTLRIGSFVLVTRDADVREVLERESEFVSPYGLEMTEMAGGSNFILGMQDGEEYRKLKSPILTAFPPREVEERVRPIAQRHAREIMDRASPGFDVIQQLMKVVPVRICREYFGMVVEDEAEFANWSIALSSLFFADPTADKTTRELAVVAADRMRGAVERSIALIEAGLGIPDTPLSRLVDMMGQGRISRQEIQAVMLGMISGFAPTNLLAGGNCVDVILARADARQAVKAAIGAGDMAALDAAVLEAMRFKPIFVGPWRYASADLKIAAGTKHERLIPKGSTVMPATLSAMFDPDAVERPDEFIPGRPKKTYLVYGHGIHVCIGAEVARVQIGECVRALFAKKGIRRSAGSEGQLTRLGAFPEHLKIDFDRETLEGLVENTLVTVVLPVTPGHDPEFVETDVDRLRNPAGPAMEAALDATGVIHFTSIAVIRTGKKHEPSGTENAVVILEISGDGDRRTVLAAYANHTEAIVRPILDAACGFPRGQEFVDILDKACVEVGPGFGKTAGLNFSGTPGHSVERIRREEELAALIQSVVERPRPGDPRGAATALAEARAALRAAGRYDWAFRATDSQLEAEEGSVKATILAGLKMRPVWVPMALLLLCASVLVYLFVFGAHPGILRNIFVVATSVLLAAIGLVLILAAIVFLLLRRLQSYEETDERSASSVPLARLEAIQKREDHFAQNNLTAVSIMKPGLLRRLSLRLAYFLIWISAVHAFRPGYLSNINSIHFARWILVPGTDRLVFFSNYGGSWESYLEDFIAKAAKGLTGVWSNTVGYPRTNYLFFDGARDGDRFKRWARKQQVPTLFWYSAYRDLRTQRIRINSQIRRGICWAADSEARDWVSLFGSRPRPQPSPNRFALNLPSLPPPPDPLETGEIQSIFFNAFGKLEHGELLAFSIPDGLPAASRKAWLAFIAPRISFGDVTPRVNAMTVGIGPDGLMRLGLAARSDDDVMRHFPNAFRQGMGHLERSRILDDTGESRPEKWRWGAGTRRADMAVMCYAQDSALLASDIEEVKAGALECGLVQVAQIPLTVERAQPGPGQDASRPPAVEQFGFADGISQPAVRGTSRAIGRGARPDNIVAAGEFLFGYRDEHGFYPVSPGVKATDDPTGILPVLRASRGEEGLDESLHDFGRNGSFIVIRQFEQHVDQFWDYCRDAAKTLQSKHQDPVITSEWIAAKMMGRWRDGSSLVRNPEHWPGRPADNDFSFGKEDAQGLRCPFGAHIRRSNPRDSLGDDHATQIQIGKRHRILRVGRTYEIADETGTSSEKGLMFMCLNADIERQYEFMQQTWVASRSFHGLKGEKDPTIGSSDGTGRFTVPRWEGSVVLEKMPSFVTTRGGGYFFMPSRSAVRFLLSRL